MKKSNRIEELLKEKKIYEAEMKILRRIMTGKKLQFSSECENLEKFGIVKKISPAEQAFNVYEINKKFFPDIEEYFKKTKIKEY